MRARTLKIPRWQCRAVSIALLIVACIFVLSFRWAGQVVWKRWHLQAYVGFLCLTDSLDSIGVRVPMAPNGPEVDILSFLEWRWSHFWQAFWWHPRMPTNDRVFVPLSWIMGLLAVVRGLVRPRPATTAGRCARCGYNLTGNVSGTCPECGTPISKQLGSGNDETQPGLGFEKESVKDDGAG